MIRALSSLGLALLLIAAPLSAEICEAMCAWHAQMTIGSAAATHVSRHHDSTATHEHGIHRHHAVGAALHDSSPAPIAALVRACDHIDAVVTGPTERAPLLDVVARSIVAVPETDPHSSVTRADNRHGPPAVIRSASPLRL